jgi:hypothetical protein
MRYHWRRRRYRVTSRTRSVHCALAALLLGATARADDSWEGWPELDVYKQHSALVRYYFAATHSQGKESPLRTLDLAAHADFTLGARLPISHQKEDWQTKKYFWLRLGYDHVFETEGEQTTGAEDRGIVALHARHFLPGGAFIEARLRTDLRWIDGDYSQRYRFRLEVNRDFNVRNHVVTPYLQAEWFDDSRYDGTSRELYQVGAEIGINRHFRIEPSIARQLDYLPTPSGLYAFAFVARWYH